MWKSRNDVLAKHPFREIWEVWRAISDLVGNLLAVPETKSESLSAHRRLSGCAQDLDEGDGQSERTRKGADDVRGYDRADSQRPRRNLDADDSRQVLAVREPQMT